MAKQDPDEVQKRLMREAAEEALAEAADADPAVAKWLDDDLASGMTEILGMSPQALQSALNDSLPGLSKREVDAAIRDAKAARRAMEGGGWLGDKPDPELAARILKRNSNLKGLAKRRNGCGKKAGALALLAAGSLAGLVAAAWTAADAVLTALAR